MNTEATRNPLSALLSRYAAVIRAAWAHRDELAGPRRLADERAFLPAAMALQETPPHPAPRRAAIAICALFVLALSWACIGQVDIVAVAQGRIVVSDRSKTIQPLETSVVKAIHVKDGDHVKAGQLLIELDATATHADEARLVHEEHAAESDSLRAKSLLEALDTGHFAKLAPGALGGHAVEAQAQLSAEWIDIQAKLARLDADVALRKTEIATADQQVGKLRATLPIAEQRERDYRTLVQQGFMANHAGQDRERERIEIEKDLATALARSNEAAASLKEAELTRESYRAETRHSLQQQLRDASLKSQELDQETAKAERRDALTHMTAPMAGTVQQLAIHTPGGVVTPAQILLILVPDEGDVTAEVILENKDVGFVHVGQKAVIKLETFPFTHYGTVPAAVHSVAADAVNDEKRGAVFPASLRLNIPNINVDGKQIRLMPGMNLTAEVTIGRRRIIEYLSNSAHQHLNESINER